MPTAEAIVQTEQPSRYLVQLCQHASKMNHGLLNHFNQMARHRHTGGTSARPEIQHVDWSDTEGTLRLNWGQCTMRASSGTLTLRVEATDEEKLRGIQELIAANLHRFGRRDQLTVTWHRSAD
jgi:hypothetical protein